MISRVIIFTILIMFAVTLNTKAFPQNGLSLENISEVNGFGFDGPINTVTIKTTERTTAAPFTPEETRAYESCIATCLATAEYNPVCGTDNITYDNPGRLNCADNCGKNIQISFYGKCGNNNIRG